MNKHAYTRKYKASGVGQYSIPNQCSCWLIDPKGVDKGCGQTPVSLYFLQQTGKTRDLTVISQLNRVKLYRYQPVCQHWDVETEKSQKHNYSSKSSKSCVL